MRRAGAGLVTLRAAALRVWLRLLSLLGLSAQRRVGRLVGRAFGCFDSDSRRVTRINLRPKVVFEEDIDVLNRQQEVLNRAASRDDWQNIHSDAGAVYARRVVEELLAEENG